MLARELAVDGLILDDATARRAAETEGQKVLGLLGLVLTGKERGMVRALKPILDEMMAAGFFLDDRLYRSILHEAGEELPPFPRPDGPTSGSGGVEWSLSITLPAGPEALSGGLVLVTSSIVGTLAPQVPTR